MSPDGGIGRRAGLKHQWGNPSRFEPGSGYTGSDAKSCNFISYDSFCFLKGVLIVSFQAVRKPFGLRVHLLRTGRQSYSDEASTYFGLASKLFGLEASFMGAGDE